MNGFLHTIIQIAHAQIPPDCQVALWLFIMHNTRHKPLYSCPLVLRLPAASYTSVGVLQQGLVTEVIIYIHSDDKIGHASSLSAKSSNKRWKSHRVIWPLNFGAHQLCICYSGVRVNTVYPSNFQWLAANANARGSPRLPLQLQREDVWEGSGCLLWDQSVRESGVSSLKNRKFLSPRGKGVTGFIYTLSVLPDC